MAKKTASAKAQIRAGARVGRNKTLAEILSARGFSTRRTLTVLKFVAVWGLYLEHEGKEPATVDDICALTGYNRSTVFGWQSSFREAFPEYQSPAVLWSIVSDTANSEEVELLAMQLASIAV